MENKTTTTTEISEISALYSDFFVKNVKNAKLVQQIKNHEDWFAQNTLIILNKGVPVKSDINKEELFPSDMAISIKNTVDLRGTEAYALKCGTLHTTADGDHVLTTRIDGDSIMEERG